MSDKNGDNDESVTIQPDIATHGASGHNMGGGTHTQRNSDVNPFEDDPDYEIEIRQARQTTTLKVEEGDYIALTNERGEEIAYVAVTDNLNE